MYIIFSVIYCLLTTLMSPKDKKYKLFDIYADDVGEPVRWCHSVRTPETCCCYRLSDWRVTMHDHLACDHETDRQAVWLFFVSQGDCSRSSDPWHGMQCIALHRTCHVSRCSAYHHCMSLSKWLERCQKELARYLPLLINFLSNV